MVKVTLFCIQFAWKIAKVWQKVKIEPLQDITSRFLACKDPTKYVFEKCMKCTYKYVETTLWKIMAWNLNNNFPRDSTRFKSPLSKLRKDIWGIGFGHTSFFTWHFLKVKHPVLQRGNTIPYKSSHANENPHFKRGFDFIKCRIKNRCHTSD